MKHKKKNISLADVAKLANVSITTASRVLSDADYPVAARTREKVQGAAEKLNYVTSGIGRALATQSTRTIGVILSDISEPFFAEIMRGAEEVSQKSGFVITLLSHARDIDRELQYFRFLRGFKPDGIIVGSCSSNRQHMQRLFNEITQLSDMGIPTLCLQRHLLPIHMVRVDSVELSQIIAEYLIKLGHREIAFITGEPKWLPTEDRLIGYETTLKSNGIAVDPRLIVCGNWSAYDSYDAVKKLINSRVRFSAVLASNDMMAIGALKALLEAGLRVPDDVSLAGISNIPNTEFCHPSITTVSIPMRRLGGAAVERIIGLIKSDAEPSDIILPCELIIRQSTGPYKKWHR